MVKQLAPIAKVALSLLFRARVYEWLCTDGIPRFGTQIKQSAISKLDG